MQPHPILLGIGLLLERQYLSNARAGGTADGCTSFVCTSVCRHDSRRRYCHARILAAVSGNGSRDGLRDLISKHTHLLEGRSGG